MNLAALVVEVPGEEPTTILAGLGSCDAAHLTGVPPTIPQSGTDHVVGDGADAVVTVALPVADDGHLHLHQLLRGGELHWWRGRGGVGQKEKREKTGKCPSLQNII